MKSIKPLLPFFIFLMFVSCEKKDNPALYKGIGIMAYYYPSRGGAGPEELPLNKLSHIFYAFTEVIGNEMKFPDDSSGLKLKMLVDQKKHHPMLKVMVSCGGWGGSGGFSEMARTPETRHQFVTSAVDFVNRYQLDGLDIDWEYPGMKGIGNPFIPEDKENFTSLMRELRIALDSTGRPLLLTFAAAGWEGYYEHIELNKVMKYANYINLMTYDNVEGGTPYTAHHTNLGLIKPEDISGTPADSVMIAEKDTLGPNSAEKIISYCIDHGVNPKQILIGAAFYGHAWKGVPPANHGLYQLNKGPWRQNTRYYSIRENYENKNGFTRYWDPHADAPYLYNPTDSVFISYEDTMSIRLKTAYAVKQGLGGIMFWQLLGDAPKDGLLDAIYKEKLKLEQNEN